MIIHGSDGTTARALPLGTSGGLSVLWSGAGLSASGALDDLLLLGRDGRVRVLQRDGTSRGVFAAGSYAPALVVAQSDLGQPLIFVNESRGVQRWLDGTHLDSLGIPYTVFELPQAWDTTLAGMSPYPYDPVFIVPGTTPIFVRTLWDSVRFWLVGYDSTGLELWRTPLALGGSPRFPGAYVTDVTGDGQPELVLSISINGNTTLAVYDPLSGALLRSTPVESIAAGASAGLTGALADVNADGTLDLTQMAVDYGVLSVNLQTSPMAKIWGPASTSLLAGGTLGVAPLSTPDHQELFVVGGNQTSGPYYRAGLNGSVLKTWDSGNLGWEGSDQNTVALVADGTGTYDLITTGMAGPTLSRIVRLDGNELTPVWTRYAADGLVGDIVPATPVALHTPIEVDVDGDQTEDIVFGGDDGYLYALRADTGALVFALQLDAAPRQVVAANVDRDVAVELLVALADGALVAIDDRAGYSALGDLPPTDGGPDGAADGGPDDTVDGSTDGAMQPGGDTHVSSGDESGGGDPTSSIGDSGRGDSSVTASGSDGGCSCSGASASSHALGPVLSVLLAVGAVRRRRKCL